MRKIDADQLIKENFEFLRDNDQRLVGAVRVGKIFSAPTVDDRGKRKMGYVLAFALGTIFGYVLTALLNMGDKNE